MKNLKERRLWLLWKKQERNGKTAKVPFAANGGKCGTSEEYKQTWVTYQEAEQAAKKFKGAGVGFVIPQNLFFLDIDHQDQNDPVVKDILSRFNTYTEYSVSGDGIHVYGLCDFSKLPTYTEDGRVKLSKEYYAHHPTNGMELYIGQLTNRYAAYTGNAILDVPLADCTKAVIDILNEYMRKPEPKAKKRKVTDLEKRADSIIQALRNQKNGAKFSSLFDNGTWGNCTDHSELDLSLCSIIAFRTNDDRELLDAVFRKSALYRSSKWGREDYREQTITKAIAYRADPDEEPLTVPKVVPPFIKINENGVARVSAPLLAKYAQKHLHYLLVRNNATQSIMTYLYKDGVYSLYDNAMLLQYVLDPNKTQEGLPFVTGDFLADEITSKTVFQEFQRIRTLFGKDIKGNRTYLHGTLSFPPGELEPQGVRDFAVELVEQIYPNHQVLVVPHTDAAHPHAHFVVETVSFVDGAMLHTSKHDLEHAKKLCEQMCRERGLTLAQKGLHADGTPLTVGDITAWEKNKFHQLVKDPKKSYLVNLALAVQQCTHAAPDQSEFCTLMEQEYGWTVTWKDTKKNLVFTDAEGHRVRDTNLSKTFQLDISKESLVKQMEANRAKRPQFVRKPKRRSRGR